MLARVLSNEGYGVLTAASGGDALGLATTMAVDLILLGPQYAGNQWLGNPCRTWSQKTCAADAVIIITARPTSRRRGARRGSKRYWKSRLIFRA